jgi:hypothetical protein
MSLSGINMGIGGGMGGGMQGGGMGSWFITALDKVQNDKYYSNACTTATSQYCSGVMNDTEIMLYAEVTRYGRSSS